MPAPTVYTEQTLTAYMLSVTSKISSVLQLDAHDFTEAVADTLLAYGVDDISSATRIAKLRALAKVEAWRTVKAATAGQVTFSADGSSFNLSDLREQAQSNLETAELEAMHYGLTGYAVGVAAISYANDPYAETEESA